MAIADLAAIEWMIDGVRAIGGVLLLSAAGVKAFEENLRKRALERLRVAHPSAWSAVQAGGFHGKGPAALQRWLDGEAYRSLRDDTLATLMKRIRRWEDRAGLLLVSGGALFGSSFLGKLGQA